MTSVSAHRNARFLKIGIVLAGYLAAFALASIAVAVRIANTSGPEALASSGMYAFGDAILFLAVFGAVGLLPSGLALVFLRPYRRFWIILATVGTLIAATGVAALVLYAVGRGEAPSSALGAWAGLAVLRILPAPLFAAAFLVAGLASPHRGSRQTLLAGFGTEILICAYAGLVWLDPFHLH